MLFGKQLSQSSSFLTGKGRKKRTKEPIGVKGTSTMSASTTAPQTNATHFNLASPSVIQIREEENRGVKVEKGHEGTRNSPIIVAPFQNGRQGSKNEPIYLEDEVEVIGDCSHPIYVDDYRLGDEPKKMMVQFTINESVLDLECFEVGPSDLKGKRPKREREHRSRRSVWEVGESSNPPPCEPDVYCGICMEAKFKYDRFSLKNCSHLYCSSCVSQYVEAKVEENVTSIRCPDPSCKDGYLEPEMCRLILKPEVYDQWGAALCEAMIGSMKFYCPYKDCSALLIDERVEGGGEVIMQSECPHCFRLFCAQCKVPWHSGVSCEDFAMLGADGRGREDILLRNMAKDYQWQRCPKCKFYVERISGCMLILCR